MLIFIPQSFGERLRKLRLALAYSQARLGGLAGIDARRISHFEKGRRFPTPEELKRLAQALATSVAELERDTVGPGCECVLGGAIRARFRQAAHFEPTGKGPIYVHMRKAWDNYPGLARRLQSQIRARPDYHAVLRVLRRIACDSDHEALVIQYLVGRDGELGYAATLSCGFRALPVINNLESGKVVGDCCFPVVRLVLGEYDCLFFFQVTVRTRNGPYRLDSLVAVRYRHRTVWLDLEVDGPAHQGDNDAQRQSDLGLPTIRLNSQEVTTGNMLETLQDKLSQLLTGEGKQQRGAA